MVTDIKANDPSWEGMWKEAIVAYFDDVFWYLSGD
jgi:hypothetical protein